MNARPQIEDLTVVIPTLGRPILRRCLDALAAGTALPAQVIVVDQGQREEIRMMATEFAELGLPLKYIPSESKGRSAGINVGIRAARTEYVGVTDDDCLVAPDWASAIVGQLEANGGSIVTGRVEAGDGPVVLSVVKDMEPVVQRRPALRFDRLSGGNMAMPRAVTERIGLFEEDPRMRTAEDAEFAYRALRAGIAIVYAPDVVVQHLGWRDQEEREGQYRSYASSQGGFYGSYLARGDYFMLLRLLVHLWRAFRRWLLASVTGQTEQARMARAYLTGLLPGVLHGIRGPKSQ